MRSCRYSDRLKRILKKLSGKDRKIYERVLNKIEEITNAENVEHYKNLRHDLKDKKRVHVGHFVLTFNYNKNNDLISFEDFDHHDNIY